MRECACTCGERGCASLAGRQHGFASTYRDGCRCSECGAAATASASKRHKRSNSASRDRATRNGQQWTGPELEIAMRDDLTAAQVASMIGRTIRAVENARHLCRYEPKYAALVGLPTKPPASPREAVALGDAGRTPGTT